MAAANRGFSRPTIFAAKTFRPYRGSMERGSNSQTHNSTSCRPTPLTRQCRHYSPKVPAWAGHHPVRLAILGSSTLAHLHAGIRVGALRRGLWVTTYETDYAQYLQEILDPDSGLHRFRPSCILFAFDSRHVTARVHAGLSAPEAEAELEDICGRIVACWDAVRAAFQCTVLQQTVIPALPELLGSNDHRLPGSRAHFINQLNLQLRQLAETHRIDLGRR